MDVSAENPILLLAKRKKKNERREVQTDFWRRTEVKSNEWMEEEDERRDAVERCVGRL